ncbi:hypothetical protein DSO57_1031761 [Entomophthora muscae]|uniref:Uncharacterized protein n=1 Tax=Entomophthora muscae TaxID=34485 RepID=A0ACC2UKE9_9FUNG|nr:hypothetical protein DSO57_1031761 [Entomophthora muscae]
MLARTLIQLQSEAYSNALAKKIRSQEKDNIWKAPLQEFQLGDWVLFYNTHGFSRAHKLATLWIGPFKIISRTSTDAYTIKEIKDRRMINCVHAKFLRKFVKSPPSNE